MNVSTTIPPTVQIRRGRLIGLIGAVAALAAVVTWALLVFAVGTGGDVRAGTTSHAVSSGALALDTQNPVASLSPAERSVAVYLFGTSASRTSAAQLRAVRDYLSAASRSLTPAERSVGDYLFGESESLTPSQLRTVHSYVVGASSR